MVIKVYFSFAFTIYVCVFRSGNEAVRSGRLCLREKLSYISAKVVVRKGFEYVVLQFSLVLPRIESK